MLGNVWLAVATCLHVMELTPSALAQRDLSQDASFDAPALGQWSNDAAGVVGEIVVGLSYTADRTQVMQRLSDFGISVLGEIPRMRALRLDVSGFPTTDAACDSVRAMPGIMYAEPNGIGRGDYHGESLPAPPPNDTWFTSQWHLDNTGQDGGNRDADIEMLGAWQLQAQAHQVVVAVLDTGIDFAHPEFAGRLLQGFDFVDEDDDASASHPHGVFVAGILGASANNMFGVSGVAQTSQLLPVRVLGPGISGTTFNLVQGIDYAVSRGADIMNMSLGHYPESELLKAALEAAGSAGVIIIASAGNLGAGTADTNWPSASSFAMSVGATNKWDKRTYFSATGTALDFVAPGKDVATVAADHGDAFSLFTGTSAAAPIASGIAALLKSYHPFLTHDQIYMLLRAGAVDQVGDANEDTVGWDPFYGHGRLSALRSLKSLCGCTDTDKLTASPPTLSLGIDGAFILRLKAGHLNRFQPYLMLGTLAGTEGGFTLGQTTWPLTWDPYTRLCLLGPSPVVGHVGLLDEAGKAQAMVFIPAAARITLAGATLHHAAAVYDGALVHPFESVPLVVAGPVAASVNGLPERLFVENFESGAADWLFDNGANGQWHISQRGECGAASYRAAYNAGEPECTFGKSTSGRLVSPPFEMAGLPPYRIRFSSVVDVPLDFGMPVVLRLVDDSSVATLDAQEWVPEQFGNVLGGTWTTFEVQVQESPKYEGRTVHIEAVFSAPVLGSGEGWWLDDVSVWNSGVE